MAAVHAILSLFKPGWNGSVTHPHISLPRAYVVEMFIEILRTFKISLVLYCELVVFFELFRDYYIHSTYQSPT